LESVHDAKIAQLCLKTKALKVKLTGLELNL